MNVLERVEANAGEDITVCKNETVTLSANGGTSYLWSNGATTQSIDVSPNEDTEYSVLAYNALDSDEDSVIVFIEECNSTIEIPGEESPVSFIIYQDPEKDAINIQISNLNSITVRGYSIYDLIGNKLYTEQFMETELEQVSEITKTCNVSNFSRGIYIVKLDYNDTSLIKKILVR